MNKNDILIHSDDIPWVKGSEGSWFKSLRCCEVTGQWTQLLKLEAGAQLPAHYHLGAGEFIVLQGELHYASGVAGVGDYGYEAVGAVHGATRAPVETIIFYVGHGPLAMTDADGNVVGALDARYWQGAWENGLAARSEH